ncbi:MAG: helix-turn-helix domain-containing protein [Myxococcota bacterium]
MKTIEDQDHYQVLEVPYSARTEDIRRAYPMIRAAYEDGSLATYSVFDAGESASIRDRIDLAYRVLTDAEARRAYDAELGLDALVVGGEAAIAADVEPTAPGASSLAGVEVVPAIDALGELGDLDGEDGEDWDGARLRRARMRRGIELDHVSEVTKVNARYLRAIEEDAFGDLPAAVYTRGFVTAYARTIGLDTQQVARSFMARFDDAHGQQRRGRLFGRR